MCQKSVELRPWTGVVDECKKRMKWKRNMFKGEQNQNILELSIKSNHIVIHTVLLFLLFLSWLHWMVEKSKLLLIILYNNADPPFRCEYKSLEIWQSHAFPLCIHHRILTAQKSPNCFSVYLFVAKKNDGNHFFSVNSKCFFSILFGGPTNNDSLILTSYFSIQSIHTNSTQSFLTKIKQCLRKMQAMKQKKEESESGREK